MYHRLRFRSPIVSDVTTMGAAYGAIGAITGSSVRAGQTAKQHTASTIHGARIVFGLDVPCQPGQFMSEWVGLSQWKTDPEPPNARAGVYSKLPADKHIPTNDQVVRSAEVQPEGRR